MKKIFAFILIIFSLFSFSACKRQDGLEIYVSELRSNVYSGQSDDLTLKASYGYKENPYQNDGKVGTLHPLLIIKLIGKETTQSTYTVSFEFNNQNYTADFKLSPVSHSLIATFEIENFNLDEFNVNLSCGDNLHTVKMQTTIPKGTITYIKALECLEKSQPQLIKAFSNDDGFDAEIYARIIVKNDKAYWYIGLARGNDLLKALLIDGKSGEVLAIREIM